jgi:hypothetical protein
MLRRMVCLEVKPKPEIMRGPKTLVTERRRKDVSVRRGQRSAGLRLTRGSGVDGEGERHEEPGQGREERFGDLLPVDLIRSRSSLVLSDTLDGPDLLLLGQESSGRRRVVEPPVNDGSSDDRDETHDQEKNLVDIEVR